MITCERGRSRLSGTVTGLLSEYAVITRHILEMLEEDRPRESAEKILKETFELAFMSEEEMKEKKEELLGELLKKIFMGGTNAD